MICGPLCCILPQPLSLTEIIAAQMELQSVCEKITRGNGRCAECVCVVFTFCLKMDLHSIQVALVVVA